MVRKRLLALVALALAASLAFMGCNDDPNDGNNGTNNGGEDAGMDVEDDTEEGDAEGDTEDDTMEGCTTDEDCAPGVCNTDTGMCVAAPVAEGCDADPRPARCDEDPT